MSVVLVCFQRCFGESMMVFVRKQLVRHTSKSQYQSLPCFPFPFRTVVLMPYLGVFMYLSTRFIATVNFSSGVKVVEHLIMALLRYRAQFEHSLEFPTRYSKC